MPYRAPDHELVKVALRSQWRVILDAIDGLSNEDYAKPTRLPGWDVAALVAHLAGNPLWLTRCASAPTASRAMRDHQSYFDVTDSESIGATARQRAHERSHQELQELAHEWTAEAVGLLDQVDPTTIIAGPTEPISFADLVFSRVVEGVVHGLDLAAATRPFSPDPEALKLVTRWLAARLERAAPGRTIEVRIPPVVAVQIGGPEGEGPRHTRGTPPNIVETDPLTWVDLAAGRLEWTDAVATHRVSASGRLADLAFTLPLLG